MSLRKTDVKGLYLDETNHEVYFVKVRRVIPNYPVTNKVTGKHVFTSVLLETRALHDFDPRRMRRRATKRQRPMRDRAARNTRAG